MAAPKTDTTRIIIAVLSAAVIGLVIALYVVTRPSDAPSAVPAPVEPAQKDVSERGRSSFGRAAPGLRGANRPPARARNELGQPLDENGRPIGPSDKLARIRNKPLEPGELPTTPPLFSDPAQRAAFKRWWVDELARRVAIYETLEPRDDYPPPEETAALLDQLYDASEPRAPNETVEQAIERRRRWHELWKRVLDTYGATPQTIASRGGDPQYGQPPAPPVPIPGIPDPDTPVPPAPESSMTPPGRGPDDPAAPVPGAENGADRVRP